MAAVTSVHQPVMFDEVMAALAPRPGGTYLDGTVGGGGHAAGLLERAAPDGRLLGLDRDPAAVAWARTHLARFGARAMLVCGNFADLERLASEHGFDLFDGIVLDLGMSSDQVDDPARGFSFRSDGPLDMRMDPTGPLTAADLVNTWDAGALADVLFQYGEEHRARRIARAIVAARPIRSTGHLAAVVERAAGGHHGGIHPATRTFQALRIAVNEELAALEAALPQAVRRLAVGGRLAVISFHSLEDRTVKHTLRAAAASCVCPPEVPECRCQHQATLRLVTRKPITPTASETDANPRARSARMRVAERLPAA